MASNGETAIPVHMVVTVEPRHGAAASTLNAQDVMAYEGKDRVPVANVEPVTNRQIIILIDEGLNRDVSLQFDDLRRFILAQPAGAEIGVAYMRNGSVYPTQALTTDHDAAAKSLRLPLGQPGESASPYMSISDAIKKWPATDKTREILMVSSGIDLYYGGFDLQNPYLDKAISDAQRASIPVYSIYFNDAGHLGHSYWRINNGQNYLSRLADETGGEMFWQGETSPVSFQPFLKELSDRFEHQYVVTVMAKPENKGRMQPIRLRTDSPTISLHSQSGIYVPGNLRQ